MRHPTILAVDDEAVILRWLAQSLEAVGYDVIPAADVESALAILRSSMVDALILDVRLVGRSGLDVLEFVRSQHALVNLPVVILTGVSRLTEDQEEVIRRNEAYVFYKPTASSDLAATLDRLLNRQPR